MHDDLRASEDLRLRVDLGDRVFEGLPRETVGRVENGAWNEYAEGAENGVLRIDLPMWISAGSSKPVDDVTSTMSMSAVSIVRASTLSNCSCLFLAHVDD